MIIPYYEPPADVKGICGLDRIRFDDVLKILLDTPIGEEEAFQAVEAAFSTDVAIAFYSRGPDKNQAAREQVFQRVTKWIQKKARDPAVQVSFAVLKELYRMEEEGLPIDAEELRNYGDAYIRKSEEAVMSIREKALAMGFDISESVLRGNTFAFPSKYDSLNSQLQDVRKDIKHAGMLKPERLKEYVRTLPDGSGRLLSHWDIYGALSGRIQSKSFNSQGLPKEVRNACIVPKHGYSLVCADYVSEELILIALLTEDERLLDNLINGSDLHKTVAGEIFAKDIADITDAERKFAKAVDFAYLYGAGDRTLSEIIRGSEYDMCVSKVKNAINTSFVNVRKVMNRINTQGFVELVNGRQIDLCDIPKRHTAFNRMIQGSGAIMLKDVVADIAAKLPQEAKVCFLLHDELVVETPTGYKEEVINTVSEVMNGVLHKYGYDFDMPIVISTKEGGEDHGNHI